jgi:uncharacterized protein YPO0396
MALSFSDLAANLGKQLEDVQAKRLKAEELEAKLRAATSELEAQLRGAMNDYNKSLDNARVLKTQMNTLLAESLGSDGKSKVG